MVAELFKIFLYFIGHENSMVFTKAPTSRILSQMNPLHALLQSLQDECLRFTPMSSEQSSTSRHHQNAWFAQLLPRIPYCLSIFFLFVLCLFSILCILCFCIVLYIVFPFVYSRLFSVSIQVYWPLPPGGKPIAVNKYHIFSSICSC
jgi:hypothetical protein